MCVLFVLFMVYLQCLYPGMKHHQNMHKTATNRPIYAHILSDHNNFNIFSINIIDRVPDLAMRKQKEMYYINLLKTKIPFGLNVISKI